MSITDQIVAHLQDLYEHNPEACAKLFDTRVSYGPELANTTGPWVVNLEKNTIGPLGLINGMLLMLGARRVAAWYDDSGKLGGFWPCDENGKPLPRQGI